uniref:CSON015549 protein n=1 Tax=Culicoides sonorensis TaxID=179676 RepID=A0A336KT96_CULSO
MKNSLKFECHFCQKGYKSKNYLRNHIESKHLNTEKAQIKAIVTSLKRIIKGEFPCKLCSNKTFSSKNGLKYHFDHVHKIVANDDEFICEFCDKSFIFNEDLMRHVKNYHNFKECGICGVKITVNRFKSHLRSHGDEKKYVCWQCPKKFTRKDLLNKHLYTHSDRKPYCCDTCGQGFYDKIRLKKHSLRYHSKFI